MAYHEWRIADFRPAPPGWRAIFLDGDQGWISWALPGWIIEEKWEQPFGDAPHPTGEKRIEAALTIDGSGVAPIKGGCFTDDFWDVRGPGDSDPTPEEEAEERAARARIAARRQQRAAEKAASAAAKEASDG